MNNYHVPVLLTESIEYLNVTKGGKYIDCTLGGGGHTTGILSKGGITLSLDQDIEAINNSKTNLSEAISSKKLILRHTNFAHLQQVATEEGFNSVDGVFYDLGVSTHQLDSPHRGFSFGVNADLDMRMDTSNLAVTAKDLVNAAGQNELANIFWKFGEERNSREIAAKIVSARKIKPIESTEELSKIILSVHRRGKFDRTHPATRVFQALRIAVNDELNSLIESLPQALDILKPGGRLVLISFHSLEDRIVKEFFQTQSNLSKIKIITEKPIGPTQEEVDANPRSRSGKLRAAIKN